MAAAFCLVEVGCAHQHRLAFLVNQLQNDLPQLLPRHRIDADGRLIEQQQFGRPYQRAGQPQFLLHAPRKPAGQSRGVRPKRRHRHELRIAITALLGGDSVQIGVEIEIFLHGEVFIQAEALRHVADARLDLLRIGRHVDAENLQFARFGAQQPGRQPQQGGLAGAVGTDQRGQGARADGERDIGEGLHHFAIVAAKFLVHMSAHQDRRVAPFVHGCFSAGLVTRWPSGR